MAVNTRVMGKVHPQMLSEMNQERARLEQESPVRGAMVGSTRSGQGFYAMAQGGRPPAAGAMSAQESAGAAPAQGNAGFVSSAGPQARELTVQERFLAQRLETGGSYGQKMRGAEVRDRPRRELEQDRAAFNAAEDRRLKAFEAEQQAEGQRGMGASAAAFRAGADRSNSQDRLEEERLRQQTEMAKLKEQRWQFDTKEGEKPRVWTASGKSYVTYNGQVLKLDDQTPDGFVRLTDDKGGVSGYLTKDGTVMQRDKQGNWTVDRPASGVVYDANGNPVAVTGGARPLPKSPYSLPPMAGTPLPEAGAADEAPPPGAVSRRLNQETGRYEYRDAQGRIIQ